MALELRIALLLLGLFVIGALYIFGRSKRVEHRQEDVDFDFNNDSLPDPLEIDTNESVEIDESVSEELSDLSDLVREDQSETPRPKEARKSIPRQRSLLDEPESDKAEPEEKLIVLHVVAPKPELFSGRDILELIRLHELEYDDMKVFHKKVERFSGKKALFTVVNMVKPGTFEKDHMDEFKTPGLSFVMNLPGPEEGLKAFNIMLDSAKSFAEKLQGSLLDETRSQLSPQTIAHLQEQIQLFSLRNSRRI